MEKKNKTKSEKISRQEQHTYGMICRLSQQHEPKDAPKTRLNRRRAIRERCLDCSAWSVKDVSHCEMSNCSLYPFRMGTGQQNPTARNDAIRAYCLWCCCGQPSEVRLCQDEDCYLFPFRLPQKSTYKDRSSSKDATGGGISGERKKIDGDPSSDEVDHE